MPDYCNCGAQLPPDAIFCHKCGKPQRELTEPEPAPVPEEESPVAAVPVEQIAAEPLPLNFHNPLAVRIGLSMATIATLLSWLPFVNIALWGAAGFFAVFFYRRRTGHLLTVRSGLRMGWITGVLMFAITTVVFTATVIPIAMSGGLATLFQSQLKNLPADDPNMQEALRYLQTGSGIAMLMIFTLAMLFVFITCLSMVGGALGAKLTGRDQRTAP